MAGPFFGGVVFGGGFFGASTTRVAVQEGRRPQPARRDQQRQEDEQLMTMIRGIAPAAFAYFEDE